MGKIDFYYLLEYSIDNFFPIFLIASYNINFSFWHYILCIMLLCKYLLCV